MLRLRSCGRQHDCVAATAARDGPLAVQAPHSYDGNTLRLRHRGRIQKHSEASGDQSCPFRSDACILLHLDSTCSDSNATETHGSVWDLVTVP